MNITKADFIYSMWNLWSSLVLLILGVYTVNKFPIIAYPLLILSITFFSIWSSFIYKLLIKRNKK